MSVRASDWISIGAVVVSVGAVFFAKRAADFAGSKDRRERIPSLTFTLTVPQPAPIDSAIYRVHNDGPEELTSVVVHRPEPADDIIYPVVLTGDGRWKDAVDLGRMRVGDSARITLCCGGAITPPEFEVRIDCVGMNRRRDRWTITRVFPPPRGGG